MSSVNESTFQGASGVWRKMNERVPSTTKAITYCGGVFMVMALSMILPFAIAGSTRLDVIVGAASPFLAAGFIPGTIGAVCWGLHGRDAKMKDILRRQGIIGLDGSHEYDTL